MQSASPVISVGLTDVRHSPDAESELVTQALMNVPAFPDENVGEWAHVTLPDYKGWVLNNTIGDAVKKGFTRIGERCGTPLGLVAVINTPATPLYEQETGEQTLDTLYLSTVLPILDATPDERIQVALPDEQAGWITRKDVLLQQQETIFPKQAHAATIHYARMFLGVPYLWGGTSCQGIDCSGFVQLCNRMSGHLLPRDADQQHNALSISVARPNMREGDLIFFGREHITHVAMALNSTEFIHAEGQNYNRVTINSFSDADKHFDKRLLDIVYGLKRIEE